MKTIIELDKVDIMKVLAEYYQVPAHAVYLEIHKEIEGYGMMEHFVHNVYAKIVKEDNKDL